MSVVYRTKFKRVEQTREDSIYESALSTFLTAVQFLANIVLAYIFSSASFFENGNALLLINFVVHFVVQYMLRRFFSRNSQVEKVWP